MPKVAFYSARCHHGSMDPSAHARLLARSLLALMLVCAGGCGGDASSAGSAGALEDAGPAGATMVAACPDGEPTCIPAAVQVVLQDKCLTCHSDPPMSFAPMALTTQEAFQGMHAGAQQPNYARAAVRIRNERQPMPPVRSPQLTDEERATLLDWLDQGALSGP